MSKRCFHVHVVGEGEAVRIPESCGKQATIKCEAVERWLPNCYQEVGECPYKQKNRETNKQKFPTLSFIFWSWHQKQGLIRCCFGSGWFHSPHGCSPSVTLEKIYHFFSVMPSFGHVKYGTTSSDRCDKLKWASHLAPKWREVRGKGDITEEMWIHDRGACNEPLLHIAPLCIETKSQWPYAVLYMYLHWNVLLIFCVAFEPYKSFTIDKKFFCFHHHSCIFKPWCYPIHLPHS